MTLTLEREEIQKEIPYALICETMEGSRWDTGKRKRLWNQLFTESEKRMAAEIRKEARKWYLVKGLPEFLTLSPSRMRLWQKLGEFCMGI